MKFFAKQRVDQIGITAVTLQKILLFLMILSLLSLFNGGFFSFLLCLIGFIGAYKRSSGLLTAYFSISLVIIVLCTVFAVSSLFVVTSEDYVYDSSSSSSSSSVASSDKPTVPHGSVHNFQVIVMRKLNGIGSESASHDTVGSTNSLSAEDDATVGLIFLFVVVMIFAFFLAYLKMYSIVLAWRLRKMIILSAAATPLPTTDNTQTHEFAPSNTSCAVPDSEAPVPAPVSPFQPAPLFAPGFAPYPYMPMMVPPQMQGQFQGQYPHHVMFGQQPVFYTYAPMPPQPEEKL